MKYFQIHDKSELELLKERFENIPAQNLHKKAGFTQIDNPDWQDGIIYQLKF